MLYDRNQVLRLLRYLLLYVLIVGVGILLWWGFASLAEQRDSYKNQLTEATSQPTPTVTVTKTLPPKTLPPKTVEVTVRAQERAARSSSRSSSVEDTLACIRRHESGGGVVDDNYTAVSDTGKFRGAYQFHPDYAPTWAIRAGYKYWAGKPADKWPPTVQDAVAADMGRSGWGHWSKHTSYHCPGF